MSGDFASDFDEAADAAVRTAEERDAQEMQAEQLRLINLSLDIEAEERSPLFQALMAKANAESDAAIEEFLFCDPNDVAKVKDLQWRALRPRLVAGWLKEALEPGRAAEQAMREADYAENQARE